MKQSYTLEADHTAQEQAIAVPVSVDEQSVTLSDVTEHAVTLDAEPDVMLVTAGEQGPPGRPGEPGPAGGSALQRIAGTALSALRVVYELDGQVYLLDYMDGDHIALALGVTLNAAPMGGLLNVQRSGAMDDASWSWTPGLVWLGSDGALTQTPATAGFRLNVGVAVSPTRLLLNLDYPIDLGV